MTTEEGTNTATATSSEANQWWLFGFFIVMLKFIFLVLDPGPKLFLGDSICYISTALEGWIPDDRSYFYGFVIRWVALSMGTLTSLLVLQSLVSAATALLLAYTCRSMFGLSARASYIMGFICALDPFQLVWERYVMTETISLFFYVASLYFAFHYLRHRAIRHLAIIHALWVLLIGFRMSYLLIVQVSAVLLPMIAFSPLLLGAWRNRGGTRGNRAPLVKTALVHVAASIAMMFLFHGAYKQVNGLITGRGPAYLYATGLHLLAFWAPILVPADATDERLARIIGEGDEFDIKELAARNDQRFAEGHLVPRWQEAEPDVERSNEVAKETALRALRRDPVGVLRLAVQTFAQYWNLKDLRHYATIDLGHNDLTAEHCAMLAEKFNFTTDGRIIGAPPTLLQRFFLISWPYCHFVFLAPIVGVSALCLTREKSIALVVLLHLVIILVVTFTFTVAPSLRYLQPASVLSLFLVALCFQALRNRGLSEEPAVSLP